MGPSENTILNSPIVMPIQGPSGKPHLRKEEPEWGHNGAAFSIKKIDNGFIVYYSRYEGESWKQRYVATAGEIGDVITAILVEMKLDQ